MDSIKNDKSSVRLVDRQSVVNKPSFPMSPVYAKDLRLVARPLREPNRNRLDSWKEIAVHLDREVRTVQRWEKHEGLPVHRHPHLKRSTVFAFRSEIDGWLRRRVETPSRAHPTRKPSRCARKAWNPPLRPTRQMLATLRVWLATIELAS
jgi:hypothetical protein